MRVVRDSWWHQISDIRMYIFATLAEKKDMCADPDLAHGTLQATDTSGLAIGRFGSVRAEAGAKHLTFFETQRHCWWFRNLARKPVEVGSFILLFTRFYKHLRWWLAGFLNHQQHVGRCRVGEKQLGRFVPRPHWNTSCAWPVNRIWRWR